MIWPTPTMETAVTIHSFSTESLNQTLYALNNKNLGSGVSAVWPTANRAILIPFFVNKLFSFSTMFVMNGATTSGNLDMGIYDLAGNRIVSSGSTAQSATINDVQLVPVSTTNLGPGVYYMALSLDNITGTVFRNVTGIAAVVRTTGMAGIASGFPLPALASLTNTNADYIPLFGLSTNSTI